MDSTKVKFSSVYKPKRKPNLVRWMTKHQVGGSVVSIDIGTSRAIASQHLNDLRDGK